MVGTGQQVRLDTFQSTPDAGSVSLGIDPSFLKNTALRKSSGTWAANFWPVCPQFPVTHKLPNRLWFTMLFSLPFSIKTAALRRMLKWHVALKKNPLLTSSSNNCIWILNANCKVSVGFLGFCLKQELFCFFNAGGSLTAYIITPKDTKDLKAPFKHWFKSNSSGGKWTCVWKVWIFWHTFPHICK